MYKKNKKRKNSTKNENYRPTSFINTNAKILNRLPNQIHILHYKCYIYM